MRGTSTAECVITLNAEEPRCYQVVAKEAKKTTLSILLIVLLGCKSEKPKFSGVPETLILKGEPIPINEIGFPFLNMLYDNLIILNQTDTNLFSVFETKNFTKIAAFGNMGNGPGEFVMPTYSTKINQLGKSNNELLIHDLETNAISSIQANLQTAKAQPRILTKKIPNTGAGYVRKVILESDSTLIFMPENLGRIAVV
jgi:hypothetical protein